jgi:ferredoxin
MCSYHIPKLFPKFSMCSPRVFPIAPSIKPICFAQNPPLLTYIAGVFVARGNSPGEKLWRTFSKREISSSQWEVQSCSQGALVFLLLSFGFRVGRLEGRFFFPSCIWCGECTVQCPLDIGLSMQVLFRVVGAGGRGGFIFLSANRRAQGALLLFLLS